MDPRCEVDYVVDVNSEGVWETLMTLGERFEVVWMFAAPPCGPGSNTCVQYHSAQVRPGASVGAAEIPEHLWSRRSPGGNQPPSENLFVRRRRDPSDHPRRGRGVAATRLH